MDPKVAFPSGEEFERPENSPVDCFQRERAGRPLGDFPENACIVPGKTDEVLVVGTTSIRAKARDAMSQEDLIRHGYAVPPSPTGEGFWKTVGKISLPLWGRVRAPGKQSSGLFSARTGRQALGGFDKKCLHCFVEDG